MEEIKERGINVMKIPFSPPDITEEEIDSGIRSIEIGMDYNRTEN